MLQTSQGQFAFTMTIALTVNSINRMDLMTMAIPCITILLDNMRSE